MYTNKRVMPNRQKTEKKKIESNPDWPYDDSSLLIERDIIQLWQFGWCGVSQDGIQIQVLSFTTGEILSKSHSLSKPQFPFL